MDDTRRFLAEMIQWIRTIAKYNGRLLLKGVSHVAQSARTGMCRLCGTQNTTKTLKQIKYMGPNEGI